MGIIQGIKALFGKRDSLTNPVKHFNDIKRYVVLLPDNEFFFYLMWEPFLNLQKKLNENGKKVMFVLDDKIHLDSESSFENLTVVNREDKSGVSATKHEFVEEYRGQGFICCNFPHNELAKLFRKGLQPSLSLSVGSFVEDYNVVFEYNGHYEKFVRSFYAFFCINRRSIGGFFRIRKNSGKGIAVNRELYSRYKGEKIAKPLIIDNNRPFSAVDLGKEINKNEYIVSYMDRIAAIGYLMKKKVICVADDAEMIPKGIDYCRGTGGEIDYFIE